MRVSDKSGVNQIQAGITKNRSQMMELQNQAATMKRVTKPSDDPVATSRTQAARTDRYTGEQYLKNLNLAKAYLEGSEQALGDLNEILLRVKELALSQANDPGANELTRKTTAVEVDQLYRQAINIANRKFGDRFLFGGFQTEKAPFDFEGNYHGDDGEIRIEINKGVYLPVNLPGVGIFMGKEFMESPPWTLKRDQALDTDIPVLRGPAAAESPQLAEVRAATTNDRVPVAGFEYEEVTAGIDIFGVLRKLDIGLRANDKLTVQQSLDDIDQALDQVILARSKLGARLMNAQATQESITRTNIDNKVLESQYEDADTFELVSDIKKNQTTLEATLATSGKILPPSLLDFLR